MLTMCPGFIAVERYREGLLVDFLIVGTEGRMGLIYVHVHYTYSHCSDVIDVTVIEPHSMETAEVRGRTRDY